MSVTNWRIYCNTEGGWVHGWKDTSEGEPTVCFNNNTHEVNLNSCQILNTTALLDVKIQQERVATGGNFRSEGYSLTCPANSTTIDVLTWPFPVSIMNVTILGKEDIVGDTADVYINISNAGTITTEAAIGSTVFYISPVTMAYLFVGYEIIINGESLGRVLSIDTSTSTVTMENASTILHEIGEFIEIRINLVKNHNMNSYNHTIARSIIGGKSLPTGLAVNLAYTNNGSLEKTFKYNIEYMY